MRNCAVTKLTLGLLLILCTAICKGESATPTLRDSLFNVKELRNEQSAHQLLDILQRLYTNGEPDMANCCAEALSQYGWFLIQNDEWSISLGLFEQAAAYCPDDKETLFYSIQSGLAAIYLYSKENEKSRKLFLNAYTFYKQSEYYEEFAKVCCNLGTLHKREGNSVKASSYYSEALSVAEAHHLDMLYCIILIYMEAVEKNDAVKYELLNRGIKLSFEKEFTILYASNHLALSRYYFGTRHYPQALEAVNKSISYAELYGQQNVLIDCYQLKGEIYSAQKDYPMAYSCAAQRENLQSKYVGQQMQSIFAHQQYIYSLLGWCRAHVATLHDNPTETIPDNTFWHDYKVWMWISIILALITAAALGGTAYYRHRNIHHATDSNDGTEPIPYPTTDEAREQITVLENNMKNLEAQVDYFYRFYCSFNGLLAKIRAMVRQSYKHADADQQAQLRNVNSFITQNMLPAKENPYSERLNNENAAFVERLEKRFPEITENDKKLAVFLRMNFSTHEISFLTGNQLKSINMGRYRLRKTLRLSSDEDLVDFLREI